MKQIMDQHLEKAESIPITFLVGTLLELRNAIETEFFHKHCYEKLYEFYLTRHVLTEEEIFEIKKGSKRIVNSSKIQEVCSSMGSLNYYESSFLPGEMRPVIEDIAQIGNFFSV